MSSTIVPPSTRTDATCRWRRARAGGAKYDQAASTRPLPLRTNFLWIAAGNAAHALSRWGLVVAVAQLGDLEMLGQIVLAFAICNPISALADLGLRGVQVTDAQQKHAFGDYLGLRLVSVLGALAASTAFALGAGYSATVVGLVFVVALGKAFESISDVFHGMLQQKERMDRIGSALLMRGPATLGLLAAGLWLTGSLHVAIVGFPLAMAASFFLFDLPNGRRMLHTSSATGAEVSPNAIHSPQWHLGTMAGLAWVALPLGLVMLVARLDVSAPQLMIEGCLGQKALGIFGALQALAVAGSLVFSAMAQSAAPRLAKHHAAGDLIAFVRLVAILTGIVVGAGIVMVGLMVVAGRPIVSMVYGSQFAEHTTLAVYLMLGASIAFVAAPLGRAVMAARLFWPNLAIRSLGVAVMAALLPMLIARHQLLGAAYAVVCGAVTTVLAYALMLAWLLWTFPSKPAPDLSCPTR